MFCQPNYLAFDLFRLDQVVGIQVLHEIAGRMCQAHVERGSLAPIFLLNKLEVRSRK